MTYDNSPYEVEQLRPDGTMRPHFAKLGNYTAMQGRDCSVAIWDDRTNEQVCVVPLLEPVSRMQLFELIGTYTRRRA